MTTEILQSWSKLYIQLLNKPYVKGGHFANFLSRKFVRTGFRYLERGTVRVKLKAVKVGGIEKILCTRTESNHMHAARNRDLVNRIIFKVSQTVIMYPFYQQRPTVTLWKDLNLFLTYFLLKSLAAF